MTDTLDPAKLEESISTALLNAEPFSVGEVVRIAVAAYQGKLPIERRQDKTLIEKLEAAMDAGVKWREE